MSQYRRTWRRGWQVALAWGVCLALPQVAPDQLALKSPAALAASVPSGLRLLEQGLVNQAIAEFEQILRRRPDSAEAQLGLAQAYERAGRDADAFSAYQRVVEIDSSNRPALQALGKLGGYRPEWQTAGIEALSQLLQLEPQNVEALSQRALLYSYQGRFSEAITDYEQALNAPNLAPKTLLDAATAYTYGGNHRGGLELFERYLSAPNRRIIGDAAVAYALAEREAGDPRRAIQTLEDLLQRARGENRYTIQQRGSLAASYAAVGELQQAERVLAPLANRQDSRLTRARAYNEMWRYGRRLEDARRAAELYADVLSSQSRYLTIGVGREIGYALGGLPNQEALALQVYRQLLEQQPGAADLAVQTAVLERQLGMVSEADLRQRLVRAAQPLPADPVAQRRIAQGLVRLDPPDPELFSLYQRLAQNGIQEPLLFYRIAQIQLASENFRAARSALASYVSSRGGIDSGEGLLLLADIERRQGRLVTSGEIYDSLLQSQPADPEIVAAAIQGYAEVLEEQERETAAVALYDQLLSQVAQPEIAQILHRTRLAYRADLIGRQEAESLLRQSLEPGLALSPEDIFAQGELGLELELFDLVEQAYGPLLEQEGYQIEALTALAGLQYARQQFQTATELYEQILSIDPSNETARVALNSLAQGFLYRRGLQLPWERY